MTTISLTVVHPDRQQQLPLQVPLNYSSLQLLQFLMQQRFLPPGAYTLKTKRGALPPHRPLSLSVIQPDEILFVGYAPVSVTFEGGKGKGALITNNLPPLEASKPSQQPSRQPSVVKRLLKWVFS